MSTSTMPFREERTFEVDLPMPGSPEMSTNTLSFSEKGFDLDSPIPFRRMRYFYKLESESSPGNTDDTESVYSIQDRETDVVKDTTDTDSHSEYSVDVHIEYEVESDEDEPDGMQFSDSSDESGPEPIIIAAAILGDSALEDIADGEDSDSSRQEDSSFLTTYSKCLKCKSESNHPLFRFCNKCYQEKRAFLPSPPRRRKKAAKKKEYASSSDKMRFNSQLSAVSSQDSGIGSSQEMHLEFLIPQGVPSSSNTFQEKNSRKRQISESSLSDDSETTRPKKAKKEKSKEEETEKKEDGKSEVVSEKPAESRTESGESKELCIFCHVHPKNAGFVHGRDTHVCSCLCCAKRTFNKFKKCPICNRKVNSVTRIHVC